MDESTFQWIPEVVENVSLRYEDLSEESTTEPDSLPRQARSKWCPYVCCGRCPGVCKQFSNIEFLGKTTTPIALPQSKRQPLKEAPTVKRQIATANGQPVKKTRNDDPVPELYFGARINRTALLKNSRTRWRNRCWRNCRICTLLTC